MNLLQEAYTALLSGLTTKTGNEIHWQDERGEAITVEPIDIEQCKYIVRYYYKNGQRHWEQKYQNGKRHGKDIEWYENGQKSCEKEYQNGQPHGKDIGWYKNGKLRWVYVYQNGSLIKIEKRR